MFSRLRKGVSLGELVAVIVVLGVLASMGVALTKGYSKSATMAAAKANEDRSKAFARAGKPYALHIEKDLNILLDQLRQTHP